MATLKEWVLANQFILPNPPATASERLNSRFEDYKALKQISNNMSKRYEYSTRISDQLKEWRTNIEDDIQEMYSRGYNPPNEILKAYPELDAFTLEVTNLKKLCDKYNWVIVSSNLLRRPGSSNKIYVGPPSIIDVSKVNSSTKPFYIGVGLETKLAPALMYLPMVNSSSNPEGARSIHTSLYEDFESYFGCDTTYATFSCEHKGEYAFFFNSDFDNCNFKGFEVLPTVGLIEYMGKTITPVVGGYTLEDSLKVYQNMGAIKSAIRAMIKKEQS